MVGAIFVNVSLPTVLAICKGTSTIFGTGPCTKILCYAMVSFNLQLLNSNLIFIISKLQ